MQIARATVTKDTLTGVKELHVTFIIEGALVPIVASEGTHQYKEGIEILSTEGFAPEDLGMALLPGQLIDKYITKEQVLSDNLTRIGNKMYYLGEELDETIVHFLLTLLENGNTPKDTTLWDAFILFIENLQQNVSPYIRKQLFNWIQHELNEGHGVAITEDGCFIGYRGVTGTIENPTSINHGTAFVNGVKHTGSIPNPLGAVVSMPRSQVELDPNVGCAAGLHVGSYKYASDWGPIVIEVKVNPKDVVSVPTDCNNQKIRTSEFQVLGVTLTPVQSLLKRDEAEEVEQVEEVVTQRPQALTKDEGIMKAIVALSHGPVLVHLEYVRNNGQRFKGQAELRDKQGDNFIFVIDGGHRTLNYHKIDVFEPLAITNIVGNSVNTQQPTPVAPSNLKPKTNEELAAKLKAVMDNLATDEVVTEEPKSILEALKDKIDMDQVGDILSEVEEITTSLVSKLGRGAIKVGEYLANEAHKSSLVDELVEAMNEELETNFEAGDKVFISCEFDGKLIDELAEIIEINEDGITLQFTECLEDVATIDLGKIIDMIMFDEDLDLCPDCRCECEETEEAEDVHILVYLVDGSLTPIASAVQIVGKTAMGLEVIEVETNKKLIIPERNIITIM